MFTDIQQASKKQLLHAINSNLSDIDFYELEEDNDLLYIADSLEDVERKFLRLILGSC